MKNFQCGGFLIAAIICMALSGRMADAQQLNVFSVNPAVAQQVRDAVQKNDKEFRQPFKKLLRDADKAMKEEPVSVMEKDQTPPSGDKHDYMSLARYFWPDPNKPDGLPYIQRDGETNPEIDKITDQKNFDKVAKNALTLAQAYYFTGEQKYAEQAARWLRTWFLDPKTCMNPNLNFGQVVKGKEGGRPSGLIEMRHLYKIVDAAGFIAGSEAWTSADQQGLKAWGEKYFQWLNESEIAKKEAASTNNHGTWVHVQKTSLALFIGKKDVADSLLNEAKTKVIAQQVAADGQLPREIARTRSFHYTHFNIEALFALASIGEQAGVDLWNYRTDDGRCIRKALDWALPYVNGEKKWEAEQIDEFKVEDFYPVLVQAACQFKDERYRQVAEKIGGENAPKDRVNLFYPSK